MRRALKPWVQRKVLSLSCRRRAEESGRACIEGIPGRQAADRAGATWPLQPQEGLERGVENAPVHGTGH